MSDPFQDHSFDTRMQQLHAHALTALSSSTLIRLRQARHARADGRHRRVPRLWFLTTACSTLLAIGFGLQLHWSGRAPTPAQAETQASTTLSDDETLDQNPDLYLWLGSENALAMEGSR